MLMNAPQRRNRTKCDGSERGIAQSEQLEMRSGRESEPTAVVVTSWKRAMEETATETEMARFGCKSVQDRKEQQRRGKSLQEFRHRDECAMRSRICKSCDERRVAARRNFESSRVTSGRARAVPPPRPTAAACVTRKTFFGARCIPPEHAKV